MIVETSELDGYRDAVTLVDGGFDPLHAGHVAYFRAAAELGLPVLCNVSSDRYVSTKHAPLLPQADRVALIDAIRWIDLVHASDRPSVEVLALVRPRFYAKGADWRGRLPDEELEVCARERIEVVYLDTVLDSSTAILERYDEQQRADSGG